MNQKERKGLKKGAKDSISHDFKKSISKGFQQINIDKQNITP